MLDTIKTINARIEALKADFAAYIADTSIPLEDRWEVFEAANDALKNHKTWVEEFEFEKQIEDFCWYNDFYVERYKLVTSEFIIERLYDAIHGCREERFANVDLDAVKEELLTKNLGSFIMDW